MRLFQNPEVDGANFCIPSAYNTFEELMQMTEVAIVAILFMTGIAVANQTQIFGNDDAVAAETLPYCPSVARVG